MAMTMEVEVIQNDFPYLFAQVQAGSQATIIEMEKSFSIRMRAIRGVCAMCLHFFCFVLFYQLLLLLSLIVVVAQ